MKKNSKILILGHNGMVGSAIIRKLKEQNYENIKQGIFDFTGWGTSDRLDLTNQQLTNEFFNFIQPDYVFLAAAKVGGIYANSTYPAEFIYSNLAIQTNVIKASHKNNVKKLLFLGSSCIYSKNAPLPMIPEDLLCGSLEPTNEYYAIAKIAGIKMCEAYWKQYGCRFISCQPTNLFGIQDNYDPMNSHVIPGMIRRFHEAKIQNKSEVILWGSGSPKREFLYVDDLAEACILLMDYYETNKLINIGSGKEITIKELAYLIKEVVGFEGDLSFDTSKPDGMMRKIMDSSKINEMGWCPKTSLKQGLKIAYQDFLERI